MRDGKTLQIAIDGPAGAGKSTIAKELARRLGLVYLDTGAMYRALTHKVLRQGLDLTDEEGITALAEATDVSFEAAGGGKIRCDGEDVSAMIRLPEVTAKVSAVAAYAGVRQRMVQLQQNVAANTDVVMDGRDIGTVVLPFAQTKIFLTASLQERARRRLLELEKDGIPQGLEAVAAAMAERDRVDSERKISPLQPAQDAYMLDTTGKEIEEIVEQILDRIGLGGGSGQ
ncbi:MAG: (d)CMP kinase [Peptococcaceae bacterium]|nr:(d)CMP kinase [Peptococcaceae bacterium]